MRREAFVLLALALSLAALLGLGSAAPASPLVGNGGFESPRLAGNAADVPYATGDTALAPWAVTAGPVTLHNGSRSTWDSKEGSQALVLGAGTIRQSVATTKDVFYTLTFSYSAVPNLACAPSLTVKWDGAAVGSPFTPAVPTSGQAMNWKAASILVRATSTAGSALEFVGTGCAAGGVTLDDVVLAPSQGTPSLDGVGQMRVAPAATEVNAVKTYAFTYRGDPSAAPNPKLSNGTVTVTVPSPPASPATGWTAPTTTPGSPGYILVSGTAATVTIDPGDPRTIVVSGLNMDLDAGDTFTLTYANARAPSTPGASTFVTKQKSNNGGTLSALTTSPVIDVAAPPNGKGTMTVATTPPTSPTSVEVSATPKTLTFTYATDAGVGINDGAVRLEVPTGWTAPTAANVTLTAPSGSNATFDIPSGSRLVTVKGASPTAPLTLPAGGGTPGSFTLTYEGSPPTSTLALQTFETREISSSYGSLGDDGSKLATQPVVRLTAPPQTDSPLEVNTISDTPVDPGCSFAPGDCTLREAVVLAGDKGYDVRFDLSGQQSVPARIELASTLTFAKKVDIDGVDALALPPGGSAPSCATPAQPAPSLAVQIAPASGFSGAGIVLGPGSSGSSVRGLSIGGFTSGIVVDGSSNNTIACNVVGKTGSTGIPNTGNGITVKGATSANAIGSAGTVADRNVIAGNGGAGIAIEGSAVGNVIDGNGFAENAGLGIDLVTSPPGIPLNDVNDVDAGPNGAQNAPILIATSRQDGLFGGIKAKPGTLYRIVLYASPTCDGSGAGEGKIILGSLDVTTGAETPIAGGPAPGEALFGASGASSVLAAAASLDPASTWYVTATATGPDGTSEFSPCSILVERDNSVWSQALTVPTNGAPATGYIDTPGKSRWYRFPIKPNGKVTISLENLPPSANYDIVAFSDIGNAYQELSGAPPTLASLSEQGAETPQNATNSSQYSTSALEPTTIDPNVNVAGSAYFGSAYFGSAYFGSAYFGSAYFGSAYFGSAYFGSAYFGSAYFGSAYFGSAYFGSAYFGSAYFGSAYFDDKAFSNAQTTSVLGLSASLGGDPETLTLNTWNNTGYFYVRVLSPTGDTSLQDPFTLTVQDEGSACAGVTAEPDTTGLYSPGTGSKETLILTDSTKLDQTSLGPKLSAFAGRSDVDGLVVDVIEDSAVRAFRAQAAQHPGCPYAENLLAGAVKRIVTATRTANPGLKYIVIAGGDDVIPFFRTPDRTQIGHESAYFPPVEDESASNASLRLGYVLGQDAYGASVDLDVKGASIPVPKIPVGRLVETPSQIIGMLDAYADTNGVITPASSLTTGYDFVQDGADAIAATLQQGIGGTRNETLITAQGVPPTTTMSPPSDRQHSWTATDLKAKLLDQSAENAPDLVFLGGHFSANDALAADYSTTVTTTDLVSRASGTGAGYFKNSLVFSVGCHSGYNTLDGAAITGVTQPLDWPQAFARTQATLVAGTGFQYGDTDFVKYSEQLYAEFANQLRTGSGPVPIGDALVEAKQLYLQQYGVTDAIDEKVVIQSTIWGLPMMKVAMPNRVTAPTVSSDLGGAPDPVTSEPGQTLGLATRTLELTPTLIPKSKTLTDTSTSSSVGVSWLEGSDGVVANPAQPTLPLESLNVGWDGTVLRGVGFWGGTYTDLAGQRPLTGAPGTELSGVHVPFFSDVFFPLSLATVNYTGGLDGTGGPAKERLLVTPSQYVSEPVSDPANPPANVLRKYSNLSLKLYYSGNTDSYCIPSPVPKTAPCGQGEQTITPANAGPPIIASVESSVDGAGKVSFGVHVIGDPRAGIQETWVTWTDPTGAVKKWQSVPLGPDASGDTTLWTGELQLPAGTDPANVRFMVQSANGVGLVTRDDNFGKYYGIAGLLENDAQATVTTLGEPAPASPGRYSGLVSVAATVTSAGAPVALKPVRFTLGPTSVVAFTGVNGVATTPFLISAPPGSYDLTATLIGDSAYLTSSSSKPYGVVRMPTVTSLSAGSGSAKVGDPTGVVATVTNADGRPVADRAVLFVATPTEQAGADVAVAVVKTNYVGRVQLNAPQLPPGTYMIAAYFGEQKTVGGVVYDLRDGAYGGSASSPVALAVTSPLVLAKSAAPASASTVGQTVTYTYELRNSGQAPLDGPITVTDERPLVQAGTGGGTVAASTPFECLAGPLAPGATKSCTAKTTVTQADLDAATGTVAASATAHAMFGVAGVPSNASSASFSVTQSPALALTKSASPSTYLAAGDAITYTYAIRNAGNVTLPGSFSVSDDHLGSPLGSTFTCGSGPLAPGATTSCTKPYAITSADVTAGSVTNKATASTSFKGATVTSSQATATVVSRVKIQLTGSFPAGSVAKNNYVWFNANLNVGPRSQPAGSSIVFRGVTLSFCALPSITTTCTTPKVTKIALPETVITFTGVGTTATTVTVDSGGRWVVSVPSGYGGAVFLSGLSWKSTSAAYLKAPPSPGAVFEGTLEGAPSGCYRAQWGAAQYPGNFSPSGSALKVKPISFGLPYWADAGSQADLAGTPGGPPNADGSYKASVVPWSGPAWPAATAPIGARSAEQSFGRCS